MQNFKLERETTGLAIIDVQEKLFPYIDRSCEILHTIIQIVEGFKILNIPIIVTEQYPSGLGPTVAKLKALLPNDQVICEKTAFSAADQPVFMQFSEKHRIMQWVLVGIEAHVCILETAKDLLYDGKQVVVVNDAISSRSVYNFSTAIADMRDSGVRICCAETVLFELLKDSKYPEFKQISQLVK